MNTKRRWVIAAATVLLPLGLFRFFLFFAGRNISTPFDKTVSAWVNAPRPVDRDLLAASRSRDFIAARSAIMRGANANVVDDSRYRSCTERNPGRTYHTPLLLAARSRNSDLVQLLLMHGADPNAVDGSGFTPLRLAAGVGNVESVKELLARGANVEGGDPQKTTPLSEAAYRGHLEVVRELLDRGADVEARDTPLLRTTGYSESPAIMELLLKRGANVNARNFKGQTSLHYAVEYGCWRSLPILIAHGADLQARDNSGQTPLQMALSHGESGWSFYRARENADRVADQRQRMIDILKKAGAQP